MIYKFHGGPHDGEERSIPEMPERAIYRVPQPHPDSFGMLFNPIFASKCDLGQDFELMKRERHEAHYEARGVGDLHFLRYSS